MDVFGKSPNGFLFKVTLTENWLSLLGLQPVLCGPWSWICRYVGNMHPYYLSAVDSLYWEVPAKICIYPTLVLPKHIWPSLFWPVKLYGPCSWICRYVGNVFLLSIKSEQFVLTVPPPKKLHFSSHLFCRRKWSIFQSDCHCFVEFTIWENLKMCERLWWMCRKNIL